MRPSDYGRLLALAAIWGASFLFMRIAAPAFGSVNTTFLRVFFALVGLAAMLLLLRTPMQFQGKLKSIMVLGIINSGVPFLMYAVAALWLPAGYSAILNATTPLMGALIGFSFFHETLTLRKWAGVMLGLVGIGLITTTGEVDLSGQLAIGVLACLIATACYGCAGFLTRRWVTERGGLDAKLVAFGSQIGAVLFLLPFFGYTLATGPAVDWAQPGVWASVLAVGFLCTAFAYLLYFRLIADISPLRSLTVTFLIPPFGILWGYLVLGETLTGGFVFGGAVVCLAVWLVTSPARAVKSAKAQA
ncbi:DMT family transporter [Aeromonas caviae]|uniref:DMT family transporter n=1 Tax=Aeromonas caviae TaxID=648 RepID=A0A2K0LUC0_AERCA|nr:MULTISPECIES: DMT family transporter [Aeromonas]AUV18559.1 EamA family transporter [Aeromonas sp. ASNIH7]AUY11690.1 EamA family transporter [Aeromonas sp. ASNIH2]KDV01819.1 multidrug DMT transporter permease [Aeromonas sp. HZM]KEP91498.1 multidrug DMT transporter permease [Aeromonas caviae]KOG92157.1 multidrug DMT transporter permease [Aeromonas caviae]